MSNLEIISKFEEGFASIVDGWNWKLFDAVPIVVQPLLEDQYSLSEDMLLDSIVADILANEDDIIINHEEGVRAVIRVILALASGNQQIVLREVFLTQENLDSTGLNLQEVTQVYQGDYKQAGKSILNAQELL